MLEVEKFIAVAPLITARSTRFRVDALGYGDHIGTVSRLQVIVEMRRDHLSFDDITLRLEKEGVRHRRAKKLRPYSKGTVHRMYRAELMLRFLEAREADFADPGVIRLVIKSDSILRRETELQRELDEWVVGCEA